MSFTDNLLLWLHIGIAIFTIGPVTVAIMSTPRYVRARNLPILRYLARMTRIFSAISLGVLIFGIGVAQTRHDFGQPWLSVSMTLFVVALVLLLLVIRDQHRAIVAIDTAAQSAAAAEAAGGGTAPAGSTPAGGAAPASGQAAAGEAEAGQAADGGTGAAAGAATAAAEPAGTSAAGAAASHVASVERGRIAMLAGVVSIIWLVILALMVWHP
jgi:hypothetical protein